MVRDRETIWLWVVPFSLQTHIHKARGFTGPDYREPHQSHMKQHKVRKAHGRLKNNAGS